MEAFTVPGLIPPLVAVTGFDLNYPTRTLDLTPVTSSRIAAVGYAKEQMLLYIAFPNGGVYEYEGVEPDVFDGLMEAQSKGVYFGDYVKGRGKAPIYPYRKVEPAPADGEEADVSAPQQGALSGIIVTAADDPALNLPEKDEELKTRALAVKEQAVALVIESPQIYEHAGEQLKSIKAEAALVKARLDKVYDPAFAAYKAARELRDEALAPYAAAEEVLKRSMLAYTRKEAEDRRRAEQAERTRLEEVAKAEAAVATQREAQKEATYAQAQGEPERAASILANPVPVAPRPVPAVVMQKAVPKVAGVSVKENWQYRITDEASIPLTHEYYTLDQAKIGAKVKRMKQHTDIPGVEAYDAGTISAGK